jgi:metal-sulfur cluster biosynthetic enzyme
MSLFRNLKIGDWFNCPAIDHLTVGVLEKISNNQAIDSMSNTFEIMEDWKCKRIKRK